MEREFLNLRLESEDVAEFEYKPAKTKRTYRMVVVRKNLVEERGQLQLCENVRYFFYVTNDDGRARVDPQGLVRSAPADQRPLVRQARGRARPGSAHGLSNFLNQFILVPAQVVRTGRRLVFRLLAFRSQLHILARLLNAI